MLALAIATLTATAVVVLLRGRVPRPTRRAGVAVAGLVGYGVWAGLSGAWSPVPEAATAELHRHVAYAGVLLLALATIGSARTARGLVLAVWAAVVAVALAGVVSRLLPGLDLASNAPTPLAGYRLSWPLGYWNAQGTASAMAIVLSLAIASDRRASAPLRAAGAAVVPALGVGLLLTVSRGGVVALVVGALVLVALARRPLQTAAVALACAVPAGAAVAVAAGRPAVVDDPAAAAGLADAGPGVLLVAGLAGLLAAGLAGVALSGTRVLEERARARRHGSRASSGATPVAILGAVVVLLVGLLLVAGRIDGAQDGGPAGVRRFAETQRRAFLTAAPTQDDGLARLGSAGGSRADLYRVAWSAFRGSPLGGQGVGDFPQRWLRERRTPQPVQNAHSLPLDVLAGTGLVGLLLLGAALAATGAGAVLSRVRPALLSRTLAAGASAAVATFLASCALDWTWQLATLTTTAILLAAPLLVDGRVRRAGGAGGAGSSGAGAPREGQPATSPMGRAKRGTITADTP